VPPWPPAQTVSNRMPVDDRARERLAFAQMEDNKVERGIENQLGGLMTGRFRRRRRYGRGLETLSAGLRYATSDFTRYKV